MIRKISAALALATILYANNANAADRCHAQVTAELEKYNITQGYFIKVDEIGEGTNKNRMYWFTLEACKETGYVMVSTNANCYITDIFTRWGCHVPGLRHWYI